MKYAIISDIHANTAALYAVWADMPKDAEVLHIGDLVGYGPHPDEVVSAMEKVRGVRGNHDDAALGLIDLEMFNDSARISAEWTAMNLSAKNRKILEALPYILTITDENGSDEAFTLVHGSADEPDKFLYVDSLYEARNCMEASPTRITFVGHTHLPQSYSQTPGTREVLAEQRGFQPNDGGVDKKVLDSKRSHTVVVGSVGQPRDKHPESCYVIYDAAEQTVEWRRVAYDIKSTVRDIITAGLPERNWKRLQKGW